jgi:hypothetical protein
MSHAVDQLLEERDDDIRKALREVAGFLRSRSEIVTYGLPVSDDPNDFTPDPEATIADEIERHRRATEAWANGEPLPPGGWGLGTAVYRDQEMLRMARRLDALADDSSDDDEATR